MCVGDEHSESGRRLSFECAEPHRARTQARWRPVWDRVRARAAAGRARLGLGQRQVIDRGFGREERFERRFWTVRVG